VKIVINGEDLEIWKEIISANLKTLWGFHLENVRKNHKTLSENV
jgi:hypothetical protein